MAIYLDHAATTMVLPEVKEAMLPYLQEKFGNPSSIHQYGRKARTAIDQARFEVAKAINAQPKQILFTSGGTEADNLALIGVAWKQKENGKDHIITTQIEHHAVLDTCHYLEKCGFRVTYLPVDNKGRVDVEQLQHAIDQQTALISVMYGNNEVGTIQPIREIGEIARSAGVFFHTDAVQAFGVEEIDVHALKVDLLTLSSHKIGGPKGVGALFVADNRLLHPLMFGGFQERRKRPGTENVPGIIGFGKAVAISSQRRASHRAQMVKVRQRLLDELKKREIRFVVNGDRSQVLPHILNISFVGHDAETMLINLDLNGVACSSGSACTSGSLQHSHVLKAMHLSEGVVDSAIRFSFGYQTTEAEIVETAAILERIILH